MLRQITSHVVLLILLVCPYLCLGETVLQCGMAGAECGVVASAEPCCCPSAAGSCDANSNSKHDPASPSESDGDPDCLCHGAVPQARSSGPSDFFVLPAVTFDRHLFVSAPHCGTQLVVRTATPRHFPPLATGRDVCVYASLLLI